MLGSTLLINCAAAPHSLQDKVKTPVFHIYAAHVMLLSIQGPAQSVPSSDLSSCGISQAELNADTELHGLCLPPHRILFIFQNNPEVLQRVFSVFPF